MRKRNNDKVREYQRKKKEEQGLTPSEPRFAQRSKPFDEDYNSMDDEEEFRRHTRRNRFKEDNNRPRADQFDDRYEAERERPRMRSSTLQPRQPEPELRGEQAVSMLRSGFEKYMEQRGQMNNSMDKEPPRQKSIDYRTPSKKQAIDELRKDSEERNYFNRSKIITDDTQNNSLQKPNPSSNLVQKHSQKSEPIRGEKSPSMPATSPIIKEAKSSTYIDIIKNRKAANLDQLYQIPPEELPMIVSATSVANHVCLNKTLYFRLNWDNPNDNQKWSDRYFQYTCLQIANPDILIDYLTKFIVVKNDK